MAIQPIDLQTLYAQLDKVSKMAAHQQQGVQLQNAIQQEEHMKRLQQKKSMVEEAAMQDEGVGGVKDRKQGADQNESGRGEKRPEQEAADIAPADVQIIRDPRLGRHIDVSG